MGSFLWLIAVCAEDCVDVRNFFVTLDTSRHYSPVGQSTICPAKGELLWTMMGSLVLLPETRLGFCVSVSRPQTLLRQIGELRYDAVYGLRRARMDLWLKAEKVHRDGRR